MNYPSPPIAVPKRLVAGALLWAITSCGSLDDWPGTADGPEAPGTSDAGSLSGVVNGPDGAPVPGAYVTSEPGGVETIAAEDGGFLLARLVPGTYHVVAAAEGFAAGTSADVDVMAGAEASVTATLTTKEVVDGVLRVRVTGPDGFAWPGAQVTAAGSAEGTVEAGAAGTVTLSGLGGATTNVTITDVDGRLWPRTVAALDIPALGGADLAVSLAGRAAEGTLYSGTRVCSLCHVDIGSSFETTAHARAMSEVEGAPAEGFDEGAVIDLGGPTAALGWEDGAPTVTLTASDGAVDTWIVSGFFGGAERGAVPWAERDGAAWPLPVAWLPAEAEHEEWQPGGWTIGDLEPWFSAAGSFAYARTPAPETSAEAACFGCHVTGYALSEGGVGAVTMTAVTHTSGRWDEAAVGCEACHGPGVDHSSGPLAEKSLRITNPADLDAAGANDVCGQCHAALLGAEGTPYPWSATHGRFRPGESLADFADSAFEGWSSGAAAVPGAQVDELSGSTHGGEGWSARCSDCHDPHGSTIPAELRLEAEDDALCLSCHAGLTFQDSNAEVTAHTGHVYAPASDTESGRCSGCHMPATAARLTWSADTAAGDLASHRFVAVPPADSLDAFDAAGADSLPPGAFAPNACQACHAWNEWLFEGGFPGPAGDMTLRATHEALDAAYAEKFP